jgi:dienelactone hydrolase
LQSNTAFWLVGRARNGPKKIPMPKSGSIAIRSPVRSALALQDGEIFVNPGANHAFEGESRNYHPVAAQLAEQRVFNILEQLKK